MSPRLEAIFFEVFEPLPRQGPGSRACTKRALEMCTDLPAAPRIIDLGCGGGAETIDLAELTAGEIVAVDLHPPNIDNLRTRLAEHNLNARVTPIVGDMSQLELDPGSFDLVWSEGAFYNLGLQAALRISRDLLRPGGYVAFTDAVWRTDDAPDQVRAAFAEYSTMGEVDDALAVIDRSGLTAVGHFPVPDQAWWDDFYSPMQHRIAELRQTYANDPEALAILDELAAEPEMHREHSAHYGYEFFVAKR